MEERMLIKKIVNSEGETIQDIINSSLCPLRNYLLTIPFDVNEEAKDILVIAGALLEYGETKIREGFNKFRSSTEG